MKKVLAFILGIIVCASLTACSFSNDNKTTNQQPLSVSLPTYENYEPGFNYLSKKSLALSEVPEEVRDFKLEKSEDYDVTYETVTATGSYEDMCSMGVNNDILYPGALIDTTNNAYKPISIKRAPITLSTNLESVLEKDAPISTTIDNPSLSSVRQGIREIVKNNITKTTEVPANLSYSIKEISNENEFKLNVGFGLQIKKFDLQENFSYDKLNKQTNLLFVLKQVYYTIDMDSPTERYSRDLFASDLSNDDINYALKGTIPAYVSSVSYGRIAFISIQTNYSKQEITNAISASWGQMSENPGSSNTKKLSISLDNTLSQINSDSETTINCYVYGGNGGQTVTIGSDAAGTLKNIFNTFNGNNDGALPISYTMRHLDGTLAKIQDCNEYTIKHVTYNPKKLMDWTFLDTLIKNGTLFTNDEITLDFSAMIDYSNTKEADTNAKRTITIPDNVKELTIIGPNRGSENVIYNELSLRVDYRQVDNPLTINLDSISFNADPNDGNGICVYSPYDSRLTLNILRRVNMTSSGGAAVIECKNLLITGSGELTCNGSESSASSTKTFPAINVANECNVDMDGSLIVRGSNGLLNANTQTFANGQPAIKCSNLIFRTSSSSFLYGGNGSQPKEPEKAQGEKVNGSNGINGGNGGAAIEAKTIKVECDNLNLFAGNGGQGGQGAQGSDGISRWDTGVDGGKGGQGGTGGNGGTPFIGTLENENNYTIYLFGGTGGKGGQGGNGGIGGVENGNGVLIVDNSRHKGLNGGQGGNGGTGGVSSIRMLQDSFSEEMFVIMNLDELTPGEGGEAGVGGLKGYIYNHSWDHGTYNGNPGKNGSKGARGEY